MSDSSSEQAIAEEILSFQFDWLLNNYTALSAFVLWFQDFFLTFPTEVRTIWSRKMTGSSILFLLSRYSFMLFAAMQLVLFLPGYMTAMRFVCLLSVSEDGLTLGIIAVLVILRVYALFGQKWLLFILLCPFIIADIIIAIISDVFTHSKFLVIVPGYYQPRNVRRAILAMFRYWWEYFSRVSDFFFFLMFIRCIDCFIISNASSFDTIIFLLTFARTAGHIMQSRKMGAHSITEVVLRDGTLYFLQVLYFFKHSTIFIVGGIQAAIVILLSDAAAETSTIVSPFFAILPNLLINRFVLNLRAFSDSTVQHSGKGPSNTTVNTLSVPNFAENRFIGNMGAPLDLNQWDDLWDDVNEVEDEGGESSWATLKGADPLTTLVPVVYDYEKGGAVSLVYMRRDRNTN
ncbi:hypothetical protein BT96DRAFT_945092 [Gymnopus androsaceus JB14]|uniref:DUF6533 domain-containing protein n=1 Tax=Gymnopus androsaceus JB14 TaxID=1447944 RepID=A0A6A4H282_9AGAR|nr:hypothetical protein BT96DRAFT_945092 [Gymnopus androsaceus JB14]